MLRVFRQSTNATRAFSTARCLAQIKKGDVATTSGFEDGNGGEIVSGAPHDLTQRVVRIYQQSPSAYQSGTHGTKSWRIDWDVVPRANRWENDLMGWASSGDYMQATQLRFNTKEDAIRFAKNQAWDYYVKESNKREFRVKQYAMNFEHSPGKLKHIRTK